jgi:hypothetical protein
MAKIKVGDVVLGILVTKIKGHTLYGINMQGKKDKVNIRKYR